MAPAGTGETAGGRNGRGGRRVERDRDRGRDGDERDRPGPGERSERPRVRGDAGPGGPTIAVVGGAVAGLAAAERLREVGDVTLYERQSYDDKRVNCGEAINDASLIPLARTPANGFHNDVDAFELRVYPGSDRDGDDDALTTARFPCPEGYVVDRDVLERRWAERLADDGVAVETGAPIAPDAFDELCETCEYVVDATGEPALSLRAAGRTDEYAGRFVALNADVEGDFGSWWHRPRVVFEDYTGYWWAFPKTPARANVGIGWTADERPDDYFDALAAACERNDVPVPDRAATRVYTIPEGPSLPPAATADLERGVFLVGDAAGLANRSQGEGIVQAIRSSYLLADLLAAGREAAYPAELARTMRPEFRLANLMRGVWDEHRDPHLLAAVAGTIDGLTVEQITRRPRAVLGRLARNPGVAARVLASPGMLGRVVATYAGSWNSTGQLPRPASRL